MNDQSVILETMLCQTMHYKVVRREYFAFSPPFALCIYYVLTFPGLHVLNSDFAFSLPSAHRIY